MKNTVYKKENMIGMADNKLTSFKKYEPNFLAISCIFFNHANNTNISSLQT